MLDSAAVSYMKRMSSSRSLKINMNNSAASRPLPTHCATGRTRASLSQKSLNYRYKRRDPCTNRALHTVKVKEHGTYRDFDSRL